jgi:hypothetical protein
LFNLATKPLFRSLSFLICAANTAIFSRNVTSALASFLEALPTFNLLTERRKITVLKKEFTEERHAAQ